MQPRHVSYTSGDNAELGEMAAQQLDCLRVLPRKWRTGTKQHRIALHRSRLQRHEPLCQTLCRLHDRGTILAIILLPLDKRMLLHWWDQLGLLMQADDLVIAVACTAKGLHHHQPCPHFRQKR